MLIWYIEKLIAIVGNHKIQNSLIVVHISICGQTCSPNIRKPRITLHLHHPTSLSIFTASNSFLSRESRLLDTCTTPTSYSFLDSFSLTMVFTRIALRSARPTPLLRQCTTPIKHQHGAVFARAAFPSGVRTLTATSSQQGKVLLVLYDVSISLHLSKLSRTIH
jgi:hypothetical protein